MTNMNPIHEATRLRCIEEQEDAAHHAHLAWQYLKRGGLLGRAAYEQDEAAYHHQKAWTRLARLIGVE